MSVRTQRPVCSFAAVQCVYYPRPGARPRVLGGCRHYFSHLRYRVEETSRMGLWEEVHAGKGEVEF